MSRMSYERLRCSKSTSRTLRCRYDFWNENHSTQHCGQFPLLQRSQFVMLFFPPSPLKTKSISLHQPGWRLPSSARSPIETASPAAMASFIGVCIGSVPSFVAHIKGALLDLGRSVGLKVQRIGAASVPRSVLQAPSYGQFAQRSLSGASAHSCGQMYGNLFFSLCSFSRS